MYVDNTRKCIRKFYYKMSRNPRFRVANLLKFIVINLKFKLLNSVAVRFDSKVHVLPRHGRPDVPLLPVYDLFLLEVLTEETGDQSGW